MPWIVTYLGESGRGNRSVGNLATNLVRLSLCLVIEHTNTYREIPVNDKTLLARQVNTQNAQLGHYREHIRSLFSVHVVQQIHMDLRNTMYLPVATPRHFRTFVVLRAACRPSALHNNGSQQYSSSQRGGVDVSRATGDFGFYGTFFTLPRSKSTIRAVI